MPSNSTPVPNVPQPRLQKCSSENAETTPSRVHWEDFIRAQSKMNYACRKAMIPSGVGKRTEYQGWYL